MEKVLMKGNEALGEAAIKAECRYFFGYPITPQSELPEYLSKRMPQVDGVFLQAESEVAAINMVYGAAAAGARVMTSSSSPGISLKSEGISYIACCELPCVIVNMMRGGPGLGGIQPSQSDYLQATKGMAHGDFRLIVLAPASIQELVDLTMEAFDLADEYRNPVMILGDGMLGQMMEPVEFKERTERKFDKSWTVTGARGRERNIINSLYLKPEALERHNNRLQEKYRQMEQNLKRSEEYLVEDADIIVVAFGIASRIAKSAVNRARANGINAGLIRPISLWPYPYETVAKAADHAKIFLSVEMNCGQMVEDVRLAVGQKASVHFYGRSGGMVPTTQEIYEQISQLAICGGDQ